MTHHAAVVAKDLTKVHGAITAVDDASFTVHGGEFVAIEGPSGSGKSTLLNLVSGLEEPSGGRVHVGGTDLTDLSERERTIFRRQHIGVIFQLYDLLPTLNAWQNVALPALLDGARLASLEEPASQLLARVGLEERRMHLPNELSGGEQQRVAIARSLMNEPELVLADEPTGALDSVTGDEVLELLRSLANDGHTVVMVTHEARAAAYADRSIRLLDGRIVEAATYVGGAEAATAIPRSGM